MIGIPEFIEKYNKRMDWNRDILGSIDDAYLSSHPFLKEIVDEYLSTEKITEEAYDIGNAKIYEYDDKEDFGLLELQVFSNKTYGTTYFWLKPNETESDYKHSRMEYVSNEVSKKISHITSEISRLESENKEWKTLLNAIKND